jgi:histidinol-phosphatase (PHP family)
MDNKECILPPDYHTHTYLCHHAQGMPADYLDGALRNGLPGLACTDHSPFPGGYDPEHRMELEDYPAYRSTFERLQPPDGFELLFGIEADYFPDCEDYLAPWLAAQPFDIVLGSVHYLDFHNPDPKEQTLWDHPDSVYVWKQYLQRIQALANTGLYDVVAHLDLPKKFRNRLDDETKKELFLPVLDRIAAADMAIEINTSGYHHQVAEPYPSVDILAWAHEREIPIVFGSDSHRPEWTGSDFPAAMKHARQAGYTHSARFKKRQKRLEPFPKG